MIEDTGTAPQVVERITIDQAGRQLISHLAAMGRKRSTVQG